jgi:hypothetical protein
MSSRRLRSGGINNRNNVQAIVEVFSETTILDHRLEVTVRGGDRAHIDKTIFKPAKPKGEFRKLSLLYLVKATKSASGPV